MPEDDKTVEAVDSNGNRFRVFLRNTLPNISAALGVGGPAEQPAPQAAEPQATAPQPTTATTPTTRQGPPLDMASNPRAPAPTGPQTVDVPLPGGPSLQDIPPGPAGIIANTMLFDAFNRPRGGGGPRQVTEITQRSGAPVPQELSASIEQRGKELDDIMRRMGELRANALNEQAKAFEQGTFEAAAISARSQQVQAEIHNEIRNLGDSISANIAQVASRQIDPNRIFKSGSQRIGAALAVATSSIGNALGQMGGLAPTGNSAMRIITNALERDLQAQQVEVNRDLGVIGAQGNMFSQLRGQLGDERIAEHTLRAMMWEDVQARLAGIDMRAAPEMTRLQVEQLLQQAALQKEQALAQAISATEEHVTTTKIVRGGGGGRRPFSDEAMKRIFDQLGAAGVEAAAGVAGVLGPDWEVIPGREVEYAAGMLGESGRAEGTSVRDARGVLNQPAVRATADVVDLADELTNILPDAGDIGNRELIGRAQALAERLRIALTVSGGQGAMTDPEYVRAKEIVRDFQGIQFSGTSDIATARSRINAFRDIGIKALNRVGSVYNIRWTGASAGLSGPAVAERARRTTVGNQTR